MQKKPLLYLAGPYTLPDPYANLKSMCRVADLFMETNVIVPFVPHLNYIWDQVTDATYTYDDWMEWCLQHMARCDAILRVPGFSKGADIETETATKLGIPVIRSLYSDPNGCLAAVLASEWWGNYYFDAGVI